MDQQQLNGGGGSETLLSGYDNSVDPTGSSATSNSNSKFNKPSF